MEENLIIALMCQHGIISAVATDIFNRILELGPEVRDDFDQDNRGTPKHRPGIAVTAYQFKTRNFAFVPIGKPLSLAIYLSGEKMTRPRSKGHFSSQESEDVSRLEFRGGLLFIYKNSLYGIGVSGLKPDEDVLVNVKLQSRLTGQSIEEVLMYYDKINQLPQSFSDKNSYIYTLLYQLIAEQNK